MLDARVLLCGDIGGTNTRLALFDPDDPLRPQRAATYPSRTAAGLTEIVARYRATTTEPIAAGCFAIAGPVVDGRVETTNLPWVITAADLATELGAPVFLLNDLEALALGVTLLPDDRLVVLNAGHRVREANAAVIAAGSGLGEAGLAWDGTRHVPFASEGGHVDFAPRSEREMALLTYLQGRFGHVSYERVVSGPGLVHIVEFLRDVEGRPLPPALASALGGDDAAAACSRAALVDGDPTASLAVDLLVAAYGAEAGNLALKLKALAGVYVGGGIAPKLLPRLRDGKFLAAFLAKGRFKTLLAGVPLWVVTEESTGLFGAARHAAAQVAAAR